MSNHQNDMPVMGMGLHWDDVKIGQRFQTLGRTITEADITMFIGVTGMVEEMFTNMEYIKTESKIGARPAPGSLVFCISEGLLMQSTMQRTGMAFLECDLRILKPTVAGDTIHVECEGGRGARYQQARARPLAHHEQGSQSARRNRGYLQPDAHGQGARCPRRRLNPPFCTTPKEPS